MAGYYGYSMSNNAVEAYENGEKPFSKWSKNDILCEIEEFIDLKKYDFKKINLSILKYYFLKHSSWHHTSNYYNCTDFYTIDYHFIENFDDSIYNELVDLTNKQKRKNKKEKECFIALIQYIEWEGTRRYPKAVEKECFAYCVNNKAYINPYEYKMLTGKHISVIKKYQDLRSIPKEERNNLSSIRKKYKPK